MALKNTNKTDTNTYVLEITVDGDAFKKAIDKVYRKQVKNINIHGFRKGKAPKAVIEKINNLDNILITKGNCEADVDQMVIKHPIQSPYVMSQFGEIRILLTHGYTDSKEDTIEKAKRMGADILILGHTHVKELFFDESLIVLNPGSTSIPKDGTHSVATIEIIESDTEDELDLDFNFINLNTGEIIEL